MLMIEGVTFVRPADKLFLKLDKRKIIVGDTSRKIMYQAKLCTGNLLCATMRGIEVAATSRRGVEMAMSVLSLVRCATAGPLVQSVPPLLFAHQHEQ